MNSELRKAIEQGCLQAVVSLLGQGADLECADVHGDRGLPLRMACFHGHVDIVTELLRRGADIHAANGQGPDAPIRMAARGRHNGIVHLLLEHGAKMPTDIKPQLAVDPRERRRRSDRRLHSYGPPLGYMERRTSQRRVTFVREVELSEKQWEKYFSQSQIRAPMEQHHEVAEVASMVFARIRD